MKVGIVGSGLVGSTTAYAMLMRGVASEIVLIDANKTRGEAEAADIFHAVPFVHPANVSAGDFMDLKGSDVVIIAAGVGQKPGETRLQLLERNAAVFAEIIPQVLDNVTDPILLVATNPVDVMTHIAAQYAAKHGVLPSRVIGSGTTLDTARFRALLSSHLGVDPHHVHGYVVGEHGDSEVLAWSVVNVAGLTLDEFVQLRDIEMDAATRQAIDHDVRRAAYHIIEGKGATYYGIGAALARIVDVVGRNQRAILTICTPTEDVADVPDVTVSLPRLVGGAGVLDTLPLRLSGAETKALHDSAEIIRNFLRDIRHPGKPT